MELLRHAAPSEPPSFPIPERTGGFLLFACQTDVGIRNQNHDQVVTDPPVWMTANVAHHDESYIGEDLNVENDLLHALQDKHLTERICRSFEGTTNLLDPREPVVDVS